MITVRREDLLRALKATSYARDKDQTRPARCGTLMRVRNGFLELITTNGHWLCRAKVYVIGEGPFSDVLLPDGSIIIAHLKASKDEVQAELEARSGVMLLDGKPVARTSDASDYPPTDVWLSGCASTGTVTERGMNVRYMADIAASAKAFGAKHFVARMTGKTNLDPVVFMSPDNLWTVVLMPVRL